MIKKILSLAFTFIGTLIGAGFASGKEIAAFFGEAGLASCFLAGALCGAFAYVFLELGRRTEGDIEGAIFGKYRFAGDFIIKVLNFGVLSAMIAGAEFIICEALGFVGGGILTGLATLAVVLCGAEKIKALNTIVVPLIVFLVILLFFFQKSYTAEGEFAILSPILYATLNITSAGLIVGRLCGKDAASGVKFGRKHSVLTSLLIALTLTALLVLIRLTINSALTEEMPLYAVACLRGLKYFGAALIFLAIFTTAVSSLELTSSKRPYSPIIALAVAYIVSAAGFARLVDTLYPVIGWCGLGLFLLTLITYFSLKKNKGKVELPPLKIASV